MHYYTGKKWTKLLSVLLTLCLVFSVLSPIAIAANASIEDFTDITSEHWAYDAVAEVVEKGYFNGTSPTTFDPEGLMTRAMFVTVLARYANAIIDDDAATPFTDVLTGSWYSGSVAWAVDKGVVNGTSPTTFNPEDPITREDIIVILIRFADLLDIILPDDVAYTGFTDANEISSYAASSVGRAAQAGLIAGYPDGSFQPRKNSTRAEVATIISRIRELIPPPTAYDIIYNNLRGATNPNPGHFTSIDLPLTLKDPGLRTGYTFTGWYTSGDFNIANKVTSIPVGTEEDVELWAKWGHGSTGNDPDPVYTITYDGNGGIASSVPAPDADLLAGLHTLSTDYPSHADNDVMFMGWSLAKVSILDVGDTVPTIITQVTLSADVIVYAVWAYDRNGNDEPDVTEDQVKITWLNYDDSILGTTYVLSGETPAYSSATPTQPANAQYTYTFSGWSPALGPVTAATTYKAQFSFVVNTYTITWKNEGGATLETDTAVAYGATPTYDGATPTKADDTYFTYTFNGWTPSVVSVVGAATYTATYTPVEKTVKITFDYGDHSTQADDVRDLKIGSTLILPAVAPVPDLGWEFDKWNPTPPATVPAVNTTYTALYKAINYRINYILNYGTQNLLNPETYTIEDEVNLLPPTRAGMTFFGWVEGSNIPVGSTGEKTFTAQWVEGFYEKDPDNGDYIPLSPEVFVPYGTLQAAALDYLPVTGDGDFYAKLEGGGYISIISLDGWTFDGTYLPTTPGPYSATGIITLSTGVTGTVNGTVNVLQPGAPIIRSVDPDNWVTWVNYEVAITTVNAGTVYVYSTSRTSGPGFGQYPGTLTPEQVKANATRDVKTWHLLFLGNLYHHGHVQTVGAGNTTLDFDLHATSDGRAFRGYIYVVVETGGVLSDVAIYRY